MMLHTEVHTILTGMHVKARISHQRILITAILAGNVARDFTKELLNLITDIRVQYLFMGSSYVRQDICRGFIIWTSDVGGDE